MKINKKYEESIYDNVLPATGTSTLIYSGTGEFDKESLESLATYISHSLSASGWNFSDVDNWRLACEYLDAKITASRKTATFWDAYRISGTISNENFNSKVGSLSNSAGYIFTGDTYVYNGENYSAGDVVARDTYGNLIHVVAGQAGYYKPIDIIPVEGTKGAYTLVFEYNKGSPTDEKHSLSFTTTEVDSGVVYDLDVQLSPGQSQSILLKSTTIDSTIVWVKPIWETWYESSAIMSRIYNAVTVTTNETNHTYIITNSSQLTIRLLAK